MMYGILSRRDLMRLGVAGAATAMFTPAGFLYAQDATPVPVPGGSPAAGTGELSGTADDGLPELVHDLLPELSFRRASPSHAGLIVTGTTVIAQAVGPGTPVLGVDVRTGGTSWTLEGYSNVLGIDEHRLYLGKAGSSGQPELISCRALANPTVEHWEMEPGDVLSGLAHLVDGVLLVTTGTSIVALDPESGAAHWDAGMGGVSVTHLISAEGVVVGSETAPGRHLQAWDVRDGAPLWELEEESGFVSEPMFVSDTVAIATPETVLFLEPASGEVMQEIELGQQYSRRIQLLTNGEHVFVRDIASVRAIDMSTGEPAWSHRPIRGTRLDARLAGPYLLLGSPRDNQLGGSTVLEGVDVVTGDLLFELPGRESDDDFPVGDFTVADGALVLAGERGLRVYRGSGEPCACVSPEPGHAQVYENADLGFRYTWDDSWQADGTSFMTPDGLQFQSTINGSVAAQYVAEAGPLSMDDDLSGLVVSYPALFGPDTRYLVSAEQVDNPDLPIELPDDADVMFGRFGTTLDRPYNVALCLTVAFPLPGGEKMLVFEFMSAESQFEDELPSFGVFLENLVIEG